MLQFAVLKKNIFFSLGMLFAIATGGCTGIYYQDVQQKKDTQQINDYIATHGLDGSGEIVSTVGMDPQQITQAGIVPLADTAKMNGNMYWINIQMGIRPKPTSNNKVLIRYEGKVLSTGEVFSTTLNDAIPFKVNLFYAIEGIKRGVPLFNTGELVPGSNDQINYVNEGRGYLIVPSTMAFGNFGPPVSPVPKNVNLLFKIRVYDIVPTENTVQ